MVFTQQQLKSQESPASKCKFLEEKIPYVNINEHQLIAAKNDGDSWIDILDLKKLANDHFKHNRAKNLLFSRAKRVFLSKKFPLEMIIQCYDIPTRDFENETVYLAQKDSDISKQKSTEEFLKYYLQKSVESETEQ